MTNGVACTLVSPAPWPHTSAGSARRRKAQRAPRPRFSLYVLRMPCSRHHALHTRPLVLSRIMKPPLSERRTPRAFRQARTASARSRRAPAPKKAGEVRSVCNTRPDTRCVDGDRLCLRWTSGPMERWCRPRCSGGADVCCCPGVVCLQCQRPPRVRRPCPLAQNFITCMHVLPSATRYSTRRHRRWKECRRTPLTNPGSSASGPGSSIAPPWPARVGQPAHHRHKLFPKQPSRNLLGAPHGRPPNVLTGD